jgi:hypothetical protein
MPLRLPALIVGFLALQVTCAPAQQGVHAPADQASVYAVDGLALGSRVQIGSPAYRAYQCAASDQFDGLTWCQKTRQEWERRGPFTAKYSMLHAADGTIVYANRYQEPAFLGRDEVDDVLEAYARRIGSAPEITHIDRRDAPVDGTLALWGGVILKAIDPESKRILADGRSPRKGLIVDFIGDFGRSVEHGLPIYRIGGAAGFIWVSSYDHRGRGTLRFAAVDASKIPCGECTSSVPAGGAR